MEPSARNKIINNIVESIQEFEFDYFNKVTTEVGNHLDKLPKGDTPYCLILGGPEQRADYDVRIEPVTGRQIPVRKGLMNVFIYARVDVSTGNVNDEIDRAIQVVEESLDIDRTRGGLAKDSYVSDVDSVTYDAKDVKKAVAVIIFEVDYNYDRKGGN